jgi:TonB family protein
MPDSVTKDSPSEIQYPPSILEDVTKLVQRVQTFTGAAGAAIALREGEEMVCRASRGNNAPDVGMVLSLDGTFAGLAVTGMKAVRCDDTENDPRVDAEISRSLRIKSMAVVPVLSGVRVSGVIATFSSTGNAFSDTHMAVLKTMADGLGANLQRWLESQGISTSAPPRNPLRAGISAQPKQEDPVPAAPLPTAPPARVETPKPAASAPPAPKIETPVARPAAASSSSGAAVAPAIEKVPEPQPKKQEPKPQGKWKPVVAPEPAAQLKPEPRAEPVYAAPSFSYDAKSDESESKKSPMLFVGIAAAVLIVASGGYFMFGRSTSKPAASAPAATQTAPATPGTTPATTATTPATTPSLPATATATKPDASKAVVDKTTVLTHGTQVADVTKTVASPIVVAPASASRQSTEDAPPSIALAAGAGPALDIPATTSAPMLSAPAPANAVVVPSRLMQRVNPSYPTSARQYRVEGAVTLSATIGPDGRVREAKVISGPPMLRDAAVNSVKQWKYAPSTVNGRAVESSVQIVLQFKMPS